MAQIVNEKGQPFAGTALHAVSSVRSETTPPAQPLITLETLHALIVDHSMHTSFDFARLEAVCPELRGNSTFVECRDEASTFFIHVFKCVPAPADINPE